MNFDLLMQRLRAYREEEEQALDAHGVTEVHRCRMEEEIKVKDLDNGHYQRQMRLEEKSLSYE